MAIRKPYQKGYSISEIVDLVRTSKNPKILEDLGKRYSLILPLCMTEDGLLQLLSVMDWITGRKVYAVLKANLNAQNAQPKKTKKTKAKTKEDDVFKDEFRKPTKLSHYDTRNKINQKKRNEKIEKDDVFKDEIDYEVDIWE
jgi:hypothetical protein